jgi:aspartate dehydrogenase
VARQRDASQKAVGIVGYGAIGAAVGRALLDGQAPGLELAAVVDAKRAPDDLVVDSLATLVKASDIIVEAAGPAALRELAPIALREGRTLVALSVGAFLDPQMWPLLTATQGGGQLILSTGAIGGLDLVRAARLADSGVRVALRSSKHPRALVQPWMDEGERGRLTGLTAEDAGLTVFSGGAIDAARLFPANLNVAAALAIAVRDPAAVTVELVADASAKLTVHEVLIRSAVGEYHLTVSNRPSTSNPATSALVPWSVLRCLCDLSARSHARFL